MASRSSPRSAGRSAGRASRASAITRVWARFTSPAANAAAVWVHRWSSAAANVAWRRTVPWASLVSSASQAAVDRAPVSTAMSPASANTRRRSASARAISRETSTRKLLLLPGRAELRTDRRQLVQTLADQPQRAGVGGGHDSNARPDHRHSIWLRTPCPQGDSTEFTLSNEATPATQREAAHPVRGRDGRFTLVVRSAAEVEQHRQQDGQPYRDRDHDQATWPAAERADPDRAQRESRAASSS